GSARSAAGPPRAAAGPRARRPSRGTGQECHRKCRQACVQRRPIGWRAMSQPKKRVAVVFGGRSSEHAISCVTAGSVLQAIDRTKYDVVPIGIATDGRWVLESGDPDLLQITSPDKLPEVDGARAAVMLTRDSGGTDLV